MSYEDIRNQIDEVRGEMAYLHGLQSIGKVTFEEYVYKNDTLMYELKQLCNKIRFMKPEKVYRYLLTFTLKDDFDEEKVNEAYEWIKRNVANPLHMPVKGEIYIANEKTEKGRDHWHVKATYNKSIKKNLFKYYLQKYGSIDFSKTKGGNGDMALGYISKCDKPTLLY